MNKVVETSKLPALSDGVAIVAGSGVLPKLIAEECARSGLSYRVVQFEGIEPAWTNKHPVINAVFEKPGKLFSDLRKSNCKRVTFAGGMKRPRLSPFKFDLKGLRLAPKLFAAIKSGDSDTLRMISGIFEAEGYSIIAPHEMLTGLLAQDGIATIIQPSEQDRADAARAEQIVRALGSVDVGQGSVVAQGICLATESIQGTDQMLRFVERTGEAYRPDPVGAKGILLKAPKPGQDWRVDLPAIGPDTIRRASDAGLAGVVVQAGGVLILGRDETIQAADELGLFLWGRPATETG